MLYDANPSSSHEESTGVHGFFDDVGDVLLGSGEALAVGAQSGTADNVGPSGNQFTQNSCKVLDASAHTSGSVSMLYRMPKSKLAMVTFTKEIGAAAWPGRIAVSPGCSAKCLTAL